MKTVMHYIFLISSIVGLSFNLVGCGSLLPHSTQEIKAPWGDYAEAEAVFANIILDKTTLEDLKAVGVDPTKSSNIAILNHADLLRRLVGTTGSFDIGLLDTSLRTCMASKSTCFAYEVEQSFTEKQRIGNFWLDFLSFEKQTDISGWQFDAIIVVNENKVIYKQWSGKPNIHQFEKERNPLGPLQGFGPALLQQRF